MPLSSRSHPAPSTSSSAAPPVAGRTLAPVGVQGVHDPAAPSRLRKSAGDACLVEYSCQPCCAGVCSAPHHRQHVARRSATTSASVLVHDCRTCCPCFAQLTRAGPYHVLTGTVALCRMGKRLLVVYHHFCHGGPPRCGHGRDPALFRRCCWARRAAPPQARPPGRSAPIDLAGPGQRAAVLQCVQGLERGRRERHQK